MKVAIHSNTWLTARACDVDAFATCPQKYYELKKCGTTFSGMTTNYTSRAYMVNIMMLSIRKESKREAIPAESHGSIVQENNSGHKVQYLGRSGQER